MTSFSSVELATKSQVFAGLLLASSDEEWRSVAVNRDYMISSHARLFSVKANQLCTGYVNKGYLKCKIGDDYLAVHIVVADAFLNRTDPTHTMVDHKDGNPLNNNVENLRRCTPQQNSFNHKRSMGQQWPGAKQKSNGTWNASITINGKRQDLGTYKSQRDASINYLAAAEKLFGDFFNPDLKAQLDSNRHLLENAQESRVIRKPSSLGKGVYAYGDNFEVAFSVYGKKKRFGTYHTIDEARQVAQRIEEEIRESKRHKITLTRT